MKKVARFDLLLKQGAVMSAEEREECVRALFLDERFAGLLGLLVGEREEWVRGGCDQALAGDPGKQSHAWGSVFAMEGMLDRLRGVCGKKGRAEEGAE